MEIFAYDFVWRAVVSLLCLSIVAGIVGTYIVVRRRVFVAGGITHASFGGIGIAYYLGLSPTLGALVFALLTAVGIELLGRRGKVREDSAVAMLWSLGMAVGLIFMFMTPGYAPNLMGFMFGDILAVTDADVWSVGVAAVLLTVGAIVFYRPLLYVAFDADFARLTRWPVGATEWVMSAVVAVSIVLAIKAVGIILVLSVFTIPQAIAGRGARSLAGMMTASSIVAVVGSMIGLAIAFAADLPVGAVVTVVLVAALCVAQIVRHH